MATIPTVRYISRGAPTLVKEMRLSDEVSSSSRPSGEAAAHIARVASRLFAERGYDATSVREIVEAAGVTKPTLYYHFGSKQGLAEALLIRPMTEFIGTLRRLVEDEADPIRLLRGTFEAHINLTAEEPDRGRFLYAICFGPQNSSLQDEMHRLGGAIEEMTAKCAGRLAEAGAIDRERVEACTQVIRGLIMSSTLEHIWLGRPVEPGLADRLVVDLLRGFGRPGFPIGGERGSER